MSARVRILPLLIFVAAVLLPIKIGNIWHGLSELVGGIDLPEVMAQQQDGPKTPDAPPVPKLGEALPEGVTPLEKTEDTAPVVDDPTRFSPSEIRLLQELAKRRKELDERERRLVEREALLKAAEQRLIEKQKELNAARAELEKLLKKRDAQQQARVRQLVAIYENMKPKDAAKIFNELEMPVLLGVVENMKERKVAPVIAAMDTKKARELTRELAAQKKGPKLPSPLR